MFPCCNQVVTKFGGFFALFFVIFPLFLGEKYIRIQIFATGNFRAA